MPLFEIDASSGELVPFRSLVGGADIYESEIEGLLWSNIEDLIGFFARRWRLQTRRTVVEAT